MNIDLLLNNINTYINLSKEEQDYFTGLLHAKKIRKKQFYLQEGETNTVVTFIISGILRLYSIDRNGFEHILQFAPPGWWIGDVRSFLTGQPGRLCIDAIEETEIVSISKTELSNLYKKVPSFERFFRILAENSIAAYQQRLADNLSLSAMERYAQFCKLYPSLIECLPQKQVAAYIGVTPEFLSKMLNQIVPGK